MSGGVFGIRNTQCFWEVLSRELLRRHSSDPLLFSTLKVVVPHDLARKFLCSYLVKHAPGGAMLLPNIEVLGAGEGALTETHWHLLLYHCLKERGYFSGEQEVLWELAVSLGNFLDHGIINEVDWGEIGGHLSSDGSSYWRDKVDFLRELFHVLEGIWDRSPKRGVVTGIESLTQSVSRGEEERIYVAGILGTWPSVRRLLVEVVKGVREGSCQGGVIVPLGSERTMMSLKDYKNPKGFSYVKELLEALEVEAGGVVCFEETKRSKCSVVRGELLEGVFVKKSEEKEGEEEVLCGDAGGLYCLEFDSLLSEATAIALLLRQVVEEKDKTALVVVEDRNLCLHVQGVLRRWGIVPWALVPLKVNECGRKWGLVAAAVAKGEAVVGQEGQQIDCTHPAYESFYRLVTQLEDVSLSELISAQQALMELITPSETMVEILERLMEEEKGFKIPASLWVKILPSLMDSVPLEGQEVCERIRLCSSLSARFLTADRVIIPGMTAKRWPGEKQHTAWLNESLAIACGFPSYDWQLELKTHDLLYHCHGREVFLTYSQGQKTDFPSPWFLTLRNFSSGTHPVMEWRKALRTPLSFSSMEKPWVRLPPEDFPSTLSASAVCDLMTNSYQFLITHIMGLRPVEEEKEEEYSRAKLGSCIHEILKTLFARGKEVLSYEEVLLRAHERLKSLWTAGEFITWWPLFKRVLPFIWEERREGVIGERRGSAHLRETAVTVTARLDRMEEKQQRIVEYKTGTWNTSYLYQLALQRYIAQRGGVGGGEAFGNPSLEYWRVFEEWKRREMKGKEMDVALEKIVNTIRAYRGGKVFEPVEKEFKPYHKAYWHLCRGEAWRYKRLKGSS